MLDESGVEDLPGDHPDRSGQPTLDPALAPGRDRATAAASSRRPRHRRRVGSSTSTRVRGDAVAARLVAGEVRPVEEQHPRAGSLGRERPIAAVAPAGPAPTTAMSQCSPASSRRHQQHGVGPGRSPTAARNGVRPPVTSATTARAATTSSAPTTQPHGTAAGRCTITADARRRTITASTRVRLRADAGAGARAPRSPRRRRGRAACSPGGLRRRASRPARAPTVRGGPAPGSASTTKTVRPPNASAYGTHEHGVDLSPRL